MLRKTLFNLHLIAGFAAAVFVVILGVTGSIMTFEEEVDHLTHPHLFRVTPQGQPLSLAELTARAGAALPGRVGAYGLGVSPDRSYYLAATSGLVFINQYTGEVLGVRNAPTWLNQVHQFHLRLLGGDAGRTVVSWAGVAMMLLALSGVYLWWPAKRVSINLAAGGRRAWFDVHNAIGILTFAFLFLLSLTGVIIGFERVTTPRLYKVTGSQPVLPSMAVTPIAGARTITPDEAVAIAARQLPGAVPIMVNVPGPKGAYRVALRYPEDLTPGGRSRVFINPSGGAVLQAESSRTTAAGTRLVNLNRAIHTGDLFKLPSKIVMSLASLAAAAQVVTGVMMWWKRRQRRSTAAVRAA